MCMCACVRACYLQVVGRSLASLCDWRSYNLHMDHRVWSYSSLGSTLETRRRGEDAGVYLSGISFNTPLRDSALVLYLCIHKGSLSWPDIDAVERIQWTHNCRSVQTNAKCSAFTLLIHCLSFRWTHGLLRHTKHAHCAVQVARA